MQITNIIPRTMCDVHVNIFIIESRDLLHSNTYTKNDNGRGFRKRTNIVKTKGILFQKSRAYGGKTGRLL